VRVHGAAQVRQAGIVVRDEGVSDDQVDNPVRGWFCGFLQAKEPRFSSISLQPKGPP
jgi:hypothetical protein